MLRMISLVCAAAILMTSCGGGSGGSSDSNSSKDSATESSEMTEKSLFFQQKADLPECNEEYENVLAYVKESNSFHGCEDFAWTEIDVSGENGNSSLITVVDEPSGANCTYAGKVVKSGLDMNSNGTLDNSEVTSTQYICKDASNSDFTIVKSYTAIGDGTNLCTAASSDESCYLDGLRIEVFGNGYWQVTIIFNHFYYDGFDMDTSDSNISYIAKDGEDNGTLSMIDRFVIRDDGDGSFLWAVVLKEKQRVLLVHDTNDNYSLDADDIVVGQYNLVMD
jgi:hypothetical protein